MDLVLQVVRAVVAGVFLASAIGKLFDLDGVDRAVVALARFPARWARPAGLGVITAEFGIAALTAIPRSCVIGLLAAAVLLALFSVLILRVLGSDGGSGSGGGTDPVAGKASVHCACFGASSAELSSVHVVRNVLLLACAAAGTAIGVGHGAMTSGTNWLSDSAGAAALGVGLALAATVALLDDLVFLFRTEKVA